jgi:hypothetical protein
MRLPSNHDDETSRDSAVSESLFKPIPAPKPEIGVNLLQ